MGNTLTTNVSLPFPLLLTYLAHIPFTHPPGQNRAQHPTRLLKLLHRHRSRLSLLQRRLYR